jgi:hypothetical protein
MRLSMLFPPVIAAFLLSGCVATAPVTFAWRSNTSQQYATTDGRTVKAADANTVNADRTSELQNAVSTSSGTAATAEQTASPPGDTPVQEPAVIPAPDGTEAVR